MVSDDVASIAACIGADAFPNDFYVISIACLDDLSDEFLATLPVVCEDGRHDQWSRRRRSPLTSSP